MNENLCITVDVTYRVAAKHDCAPTGCGGCAGNASAACRCHGDPGIPAAVDSLGTDRNGRNWPCTDPRGSAGPRAGSLATSAAPTCNWPRLDPAPCARLRVRLSSRSSPEEEASRHTIFLSHGCMFNGIFAQHPRSRCAQCDYRRRRESDFANRS